MLSLSYCASSLKYGSELEVLFSIKILLLLERRLLYLPKRFVLFKFSNWYSYTHILMKLPSIFDSFWDLAFKSRTEC